jgi:anti-sigma factor ChrR (cupin superfamily)
MQEDPEEEEYVPYSGEGHVGERSLCFYASGDLEDPDEKQKIAQHLDQCDGCRDHAEELESFLGFLSMEDMTQDDDRRMLAVLQKMFDEQESIAVRIPKKQRPFWQGSKKAD